MNELTNAALAAAIGITERRVAAVKAEGRLPLTQAGKIDGNAMLRAGWEATLKARGVMPRFEEPTEEEIAAAKGLGLALLFTEPAHRGLAAATLYLLHKAPIEAAIAASILDIPRDKAEQLADLLLVLLHRQGQEFAIRMGLPAIQDDAAIPARSELADWRPWVAWSEIYDEVGRSLLSGEDSTNA